MLLWLLPPAQAACHVTQSPGTELIVIEVQAEGNPAGCRTLHLQAAVPLELKGVWYSPAGTRNRLPSDHQGLIEGGGWEVVVPELENGGKLSLEIRSPAGRVEGLTVAVGVPLPPPESTVRQHDVRWELTLDPKHPGWSFADPKRGWTEVQERWELLPGALPEALPLPLKAEVLSVTGGRVEAGRIWSEADLVMVRYRLAGTPAQGRLSIGEGSLELVGPEVDWVLDAASAALAQPIPGGLHIPSTLNSKISFRVASAGGDAVIPDAKTFVAGMTERFRVSSLPEPAVPTWLRREADPGVLRDTLYELVRDLEPLMLPGQTLLHPRNLNRAWRQGWASAVEKGLILHRLLGQERISANWALSGPEVEQRSLTGFTSALLLTEEGFLDPACGVCAPGEVASAVLGQPLLGMEGEWLTVQYPTGKLEQQMLLRDSTFEVVLDAEGQAAVWLREGVEDADAAQIPARLLRRLGAPEGNIVSITGLDRIGEPVHIQLTTPRPLHVQWPAVIPLR